MIIDHNSRGYQERWSKLGADRHNGAYYYSREIVENIIPLVKTDRNWVTVYPWKQPEQIPGHSIFFVHSNIRLWMYDFLYRVDDVVLVCGIPETAEALARFHEKVLYLPLSVDVADVKKHQLTKRFEVAFAGRPIKGVRLHGMSKLQGLPREELLYKMSMYRKLYAVGRTAIEGKVLGCEILPYDDRFPDPSRWEILDNTTAAQILQEKLKKIENGERLV